MSIDSLKIIYKGFIKNWVLAELELGEFQDIDLLSENDREVINFKKSFKEVEVVEWLEDVESFNPIEGIKNNIFLVAKWQIDKKEMITPLRTMEAYPENFMLIKMIVKDQALVSL